MYFQTGQVIFVPEWPNWEFVSILASFCVWTKSLNCKDVVNRYSTIQSDVRRFCLQVRRISSSLSAVWTIEPSRPDPILYREVFVLACTRPDISAARPDASQYSISFRFFPSSKKGKIDQPSGRCRIPSGRASP